MASTFGIPRKKSYRASMSINILLLMLISTSMFDLVPFQNIFSGNNTFTYYVLMMAFMYMRYMGFTFREGIIKHMLPLLLILIGIFLSFIPAYIFYGQHLYHSLIVYRRTLCFAFFPLLLSIKPTLRECRTAFYAFSFIYAAASFLGTYYYPQWIPVQEGMEYIINTDILQALTGLVYVPIALVFSLEQYRETHRRKHLILSIFLFVIIFLNENRTVLASSFFIVVASVLFNLPARSRIAAEAIMVFFFGAVFVFGWIYISALLDETFTQLQNEDYNRVKAFNYFVSCKNGPLAFFLGNGFISGNVNSIMEDLRQEGIYNSDLGLIGLWNQFGLLFPLTVLFYIFRGMSKDHSFHVRGMSIHMLVSGLTMSYFFTFASVTWLCFFLFFSETDDRYFIKKKQKREEIARKNIHHYRSLAG